MSEPGKHVIPIPTSVFEMRCEKCGKKSEEKYNIDFCPLCGGQIIPKPIDVTWAGF